MKQFLLSKLNAGVKAGAHVLHALWANICAIFDNGAWVFIAMGIVGLGLFDWSLMSALIHWSSYTFLAAGAAIWISRIMFREIKLGDLIREVQLENTAAAIVVAALIAFCAVVFIGLLNWAK